MLDIAKLKLNSASLVELGLGLILAKMLRSQYKEIAYHI
jgi:hypothetical protein